MRELCLRVPVPVAELDPFAELRPSALIRLLQTAASEASCALGFDVAWYDRNGTTWVVRRTQFESLEPARHGDMLVIRTWVSDMRRVRSWRRYEVSREADGAVIARAATDWVYATVAGAPAALPHDLQQTFMPRGVVTEPRPPRIRPPDDTAPLLPLRSVEWADLDSLGHVNNARYADFVQQAVLDRLRHGGWSGGATSRDEGYLRAEALDLEYLRPALMGEQLSARVALGRGAGNVLRGVVELVSDGRPALSAVTTHRWTGSTLPASLVAALDTMPRR